MSSDLVAFLRERFTEEKRLAKQASPGPWHVNADCDGVLADNDATLVEGFALNGQELRATTAHIAHHHPVRTLSYIDAMRQIVEEWQRLDAIASYPDSTGGQLDGIEFTLRCLALVYADHPDYRPEWRP